jgi:hypothetical protein
MSQDSDRREVLSFMGVGELVLAFVVAVAACTTVPKQMLRAGDDTRRRPPGARCDFDDQCVSGICDEAACRGPAPEPGGM